MIPAKVSIFPQEREDYLPNVLQILCYTINFLSNYKSPLLGFQTVRHESGWFTNQRT